MSPHDLQSAPIADLVDEFGRIGDDARSLDERKKLIREEFLRRGLSGVLPGQAFSVIATETTSNRLDLDAIKAGNPKLAKQLEKYRVASTSMVFRVKPNPPSYVADRD